MHMGDIAIRLRKVMPRAAKPSPLSQGEVDRILHVGGVAGAPVARAQVEFSLGESVKVTSGPLSDFDGEIVDVNADQQKLKVLVDIFERSWERARPFTWTQTARDVRRARNGRKPTPAALTEAAMPKTRLTPAEKAGLAAADSAERRVQPGGNLLTVWEQLLADAKRCTRCHLYKPATQTVFGEGPLDARILFVGEQPGDQEDLAGRPFVGPAGQLFDRALGDAGIDRSATYVTNAVKHFKYEQRGKRRIHSKPNGGEISACRWWLEQERALIRPAVTVALGATAARSLFGKVVTITATRGKPHALEGGGETWVTVHPSFLLRVRDNREQEYARFVEDLAKIGERVKALG